MDKGALFTDLYQLTMMYGYFTQGKHEQLACFDLYHRKNPFGGGFALLAGVEEAVSYLRDVRFTHEDIAYLRYLGLFKSEAFLSALRDWRFSGDVWAMPEGSAVFPNEPLLQVVAPLWEAQLVETALLNIIGHQTLVATKAARIRHAARDKPVLEFGARRAQGTQAALGGARAALIGGCVGTSLVQAGHDLGCAVMGTHAHAWVQSFPSELEAFRAYAAVYPDNLILLVDTYDVVHSGLPNAITVLQEVKATHGTPRSYGVRLDSGDLAYLSRVARELLDAAGLSDAVVVASNDLDEHVIQELEHQGACVDVYGVGTQLITAADQPSLGCVYKLAALLEDGDWTPKLKRSENVEKLSTPGVKRVYRYHDEAGHPVVDLLTLAAEGVPPSTLEVFDPVHTWKRKTVTAPTGPSPLLVPVMSAGYPSTLPGLNASIAHAQRELACLAPEYRRLLNPHAYHVDLSQALWDTRQLLLTATPSS